MTISAAEIYLLNRMNSVAQKCQLGTLIANAESVVAADIALAEGKLFVGNSSGVASALTLTSAQIVIGNGTTGAAAVSVTGDVTISAAGVTAIGSGVIVNADVSASAAIAFSKMEALTSGRLVVGSSGNVPVAVDVTGDVTISSTGVTAIGAGKVTVAMHHQAAMKEATGTLTQANLLAIGTPISLIAAAGAGTVIIVDEIELFHDYSTAAYATGADVQFEYETSGTNIALLSDTFVTDTADANVIIKPSSYALDGATGTGVGLDVTTSINKGVFVSGSNFTNGNVANIIKWRIRYHVVTVLT